MLRRIAICAELRNSIWKSVPNYEPTCQQFSCFHYPRVQERTECYRLVKLSLKICFNMMCVCVHWQFLSVTNGVKFVSNVYFFIILLSHFHIPKTRTIKKLPKIGFSEITWSENLLVSFKIKFSSRYSINFPGN